MHRINFWERLNKSLIHASIHMDFLQTPFICWSSHNVSCFFVHHTEVAAEKPLIKHTHIHVWLMALVTFNLLNYKKQSFVHFLPHIYKFMYTHTEYQKNTLVYAHNHQIYSLIFSLTRRDICWFFDCSLMSCRWLFMTNSTLHFIEFF